jgi:hypothetical protein
MDHIFVWASFDLFYSVEIVILGISFGMDNDKSIE